MIDELKIGAVRYRVKEVGDLHRTDADGRKQWLHGQILWSDAEIRIEADQNADRKIVTLWHEALHGILENAGQSEQPEAEIIALSFGIVQLLRDNPTLAQLTIGEVAPAPPHANNVASNGRG